MSLAATVSPAVPAGAETRKSRRRSLAVKIAAAVVGLVVLVLVVNAGVGLWLSYTEAQAAILRVQEEKAQSAAERIDRFVSGIEDQIGWTTRSEWRRIGAEQQRYDFIRLMRQAPAVTELAYIDAEGAEQLRVSRLEPDVVGSQADRTGDPEFAEARAQGVRFGPVYFRRGSEPYMALSVAHAGRQGGVTVAEVNLKFIWEVIDGIRVGETGYAYVVGPAGRLIAHPDMSLVLRGTDMSALPFVAEAAGNPSASLADRVAVSEGVEGARVLAAYAPIPRLDWLVFVQSPLAEALAPVYRLLGRSALLLIAGLGLATVVGVWLARRMVVPLRTLQAGAERLGEGDLSQRIAIRTGDEIETLADRFNVMAARIQDSHETLEAKVAGRTRDLEETLVFQQATAGVLEVIGRSASQLQPVLEAILDTAVELCRADMAVIRLVRDGALHHAVSSQRNDPVLAGHSRENRVLPIDRASVAGRVALEGRRIHIPDVTADAEYTYLAALRPSPVGSALGVPLMHDGQVAGVIILLRRVAEPFTDRQIELVQTFADQAVIAIENVRLFEEVQARTSELSEALKQQTATAEVLQVISRSAFDLNTVLDTLLRTGIELCEATRAVIWLRRGEQLRLAAHLNYPEEWVAFARDYAITPAADAVTTSGVAAFTGEVVNVADVPNDPRFRSLAAHQLGDYRGGLAVPMKREGEVVGVISLSRPEARLFTERQIALIQTFADQAVIAIENARLFEELQARTQELQELLEYQTATGDVLNVISRSPNDLQPVLDTIVGTAHRLCQAQFTLFFERRGDGLYHLAASRNAVGAFLEWLKTNPIAAGDGTATGLAAAAGETVHLRDALTDPRFTDLKRQARSKARTQLAVPLIRDGVAVGVIFLARTEVWPFTDKQVDLVTTFADQAIIAIANVRLFDEVQARTDDLAQSLQELRAAQDRLVQTEKLASLGQLTAGIAHEIKNPLNFVNNFSSLSAELVGELREILAGASLDEKTRDEVDEIADMLTGNLRKVVQHGGRADSIVKNMLLHSREGAGEHRATDVNALVEESLNLAYHGARAEKQGFNVTLEKDFDAGAGAADVYPQEITRVLINLVSNGFHATAKRRAEAGEDAYEPTVTAATRDLGDRVEIRIRDNGTGIPPEVRERIFHPFFTTKPAGEGTGLGLSLSHDIVVKQHGGNIEVETQPGSFTEFRIVLPRDGVARREQGENA